MHVSSLWEFLEVDTTQRYEFPMAVEPNWRILLLVRKILLLRVRCADRVASPVYLH
jgi:hypothetical protein